MKTVTGLVPNDEHMAHLRRTLNAAGVKADKIDVLFESAQIWQRLGGHEKREL